VRDARNRRGRAIRSERWRCERLSPCFTRLMLRSAPARHRTRWPPGGDGVHQARVGIHRDVRLHAEVPPVALLGLVHLGSRSPSWFLVELAAAMIVAPTMLPFLSNRPLRSRCLLTVARPRTGDWLRAGWRKVELHAHELRTQRPPPSAVSRTDRLPHGDAVLVVSRGPVAARSGRRHQNPKCNLRIQRDINSRSASSRSTQVMPTANS
jgi:hypothetical protein